MELDMATYYPQKIGFYTVRKAAHGLCKALDKFDPILRFYFPENSTLIALLDAIGPLCKQLEAEIKAQQAAIFPP